MFGHLVEALVEVELNFITPSTILCQKQIALAANLDTARHAYGVLFVTVKAQSHSIVCACANHRLKQYG